MGQVKNEGELILKVLCGSRAYGLHNDNSDYDYHGVYVLPTAAFFRIGHRIKETSWIEGQGEDNTAWELGHFLSMATQCNPTVLETFVAPVVEATELGLKVRDLFTACLSRKRIYDAFRGYAKNQRVKMFEANEGSLLEGRERKAAVAYLRSLYHGIELLDTSTFNPLIEANDFKKWLMVIKYEGVRKSAVIRFAGGLEESIKEAYEHSTIPLEADLEAVNEFMVQVRRDRFTIGA